MPVSITELTGQAIFQTSFGILKVGGTLTSSPPPFQQVMDLETLPMSSTRCPHSVESVMEHLL